MIGLKVYYYKISFRNRQTMEVFPFQVLRIKAKLTSHLIITDFYR